MVVEELIEAVGVGAELGLSVEAEVAVCEAVRVAVTVRLPVPVRVLVRVLETVIELVRLLEPVPDCVGLPVRGGVWLDVRDAVPVLVPVPVPVAVLVTESVWFAVLKELDVPDGRAVTALLGVCVPLRVPVFDWVGVCDCDEVCVDVKEAVTVPATSRRAGPGL